MTATEFEEAINAEFFAHWRLSFSADNLTFDLNFDPGGRDYFARFTIRQLAGDAVALGNQFFRRTGIATVQCFSASAKGGHQALAVADHAVLYFEGVSDHARFTSPGIVTIGPDELGWFQVQAQAAFSYDRMVP